MQTRIPMKSLVEFGVRLLKARRVPEQRAEKISAHIIETEAFRQSTHGLVQFGSILSGIDRGSIHPESEPSIVSDSGAIALIDGSQCIPILSMHKAREIAVSKAREYGIATIMVRKSGWVAALCTHLIPVAQEGFLVSAWAQSSSCLDCAPFGGIDPCFSTNPIAMAFPTPDGNPVVADFSTSTLSMGATGLMVKKKKQSRTPRFLDENGRPVCDPTVVKHGGSMMFAGGETEGYKGYALSLFNEALAITAGGNANNPDMPGHQNFGLTVINPDSFAGKDYYLPEMKRFMARVRSSRPRDGVEHIRFPGERGFQALEDSRMKGVTLDEEKIKMLKKLAADYGVESPINLSE